MKFLDYYIRLFKIIIVYLEISIYKLELLLNYKIHLIFHAYLLKTTILNNLELFSTRELIYSSLAFKNNKKEYEIEEILDYKNI
jgi:hypothetical protein